MKIIYHILLATITLFPNLSWGDATSPDTIQHVRIQRESVGEVDSIKSLRLLSGERPGQLVQVAGYYIAGDGGGGPLRRWDVTSTCVDDGGACLDPAAAGAGRWVFMAALPALNVQSFGAKGDGITNDTSSIQKAINYISPGTLEFPPGVYRTDKLAIKDGLQLHGTWGVTTLKVIDGVDTNILYNPGAGIPTTIDYLSLEGLIFDGNLKGSPRALARSAVGADGVTFFTAKNCLFQNSSGYGLALQGRQNGKQSGAQTEIYLENCYFFNNGAGKIAAKNSNYDTYDGLDIKDCDKLTIIGGGARGNADKGIDIRGSAVSLTGVFSDENGTTGFGFAGNASTKGTLTPRESSINATNLTARHNGVEGVQIANGYTFETNVQPVRVNLSNYFGDDNKFGLRFVHAETVEFNGSNIQIKNSKSHGVSIESSLMAFSASNILSESNGGSGIYNRSADGLFSNVILRSNKGYGYEEAGDARDNTINGGINSKNTAGTWKYSAPHPGIDSNIKRN